LRPLIIYSSSYLLLFALHILFAANEFDFMFQIVAIMLVCMTFFCGPILQLLEWQTNAKSVNPLRLGFFMSLPLSAGIAYAYTDMMFEIGATLTALVLTSFTHGGLFLLMKGK